MLTAFLALYVSTFVYLLPGMVDLVTGDFADGDASDNGDDSEDTPQPNTPDILVETEGTYTGSADDDLIETPEDITVSDAEIFGNAGNDIIDVSVTNSLIDGFTGDDQITVDGSDTTIKGRDGDDNITVLDAGGMSGDGGIGNDTFAITPSDTIGANSAYDGGKGDDSFDWTYVVTERAEPAAIMSELTLIGGEGADTFTLNMTGGAYTGLSTAPATVLSINDFDKDEDVLVIDVSETAPTHGRSYSDIDIQDLEDGSGSEITVTFAGSDTAPAVSAAIALQGVTGLTTADIAILEPA